MSKTHDQLIDLKRKVDETESLYEEYCSDKPDVISIINKLETKEREFNYQYGIYGRPSHKKQLISMINRLEKGISRLSNRITLDHNFKNISDIKKYYIHVVYRDKLIDEILEDGNR